jgi:mannan endo-1,4-beta-mannosidase
MPSFVRTEGTRFVLDGRPYPIVGANCYYLGYCPPESAGMVDSVLDAAESLSLNVLRIWAFLDLGTSTSGPPANGMFGTCFQYHDGARIVQVDGPNGLERLDRAVAGAASRGMKVILALVNSLPDFGGMDQYLRWLPAANSESFHDDFYTREDVCLAYENWVRHLVERTNVVTGRKYRDEPAILAWELANEPRCQSPKGLPCRKDCARSGRILAWINRMSAFVKSIDSNHLVTTGDEGFFNRSFSCNHLYNGSYGVDCVKFAQAAAVDFGTYHLYPQNWNQADPAFGARWIRQHQRVAERVGKPVLLEEFGLETGTADRDRLYSEWLRAAGSSLFWMLGGNGADGQRLVADKQFSIFHSGDAPAIVVFARETNPRADETAA